MFFLQSRIIKVAVLILVFLSCLMLIPNLKSWANDNAYIVTQGNFTQSITPHEKSKSASETYDYYNSQSHTNFELAEQSLIFLYENINNNELSLYIVHDDGNGGSGGNVRFDIKNMSSSCFLEVKDDGGDLDDLSTPDDQLKWNWYSDYTDGAVISGFDKEFKIQITPYINSGINDLNIVTGTLENPNYIPLPSMEKSIVIQSKDITQQLRWAFETGNYIHSSPAIADDGTIYFGSGDNKIYSVNTNGKFKWSYKTNGDIYSSPAIINNNKIVVGSSDGSLYAFDKSGQLLWSKTLGNKVNSSPAVGTNGTIYVGSSDGSLYAISDDGNKQWSYSTQGAIESSPAVGTNGTIYVGSADGSLYAISSKGNKKWSYSTQGAIKSSPAIDHNGTIYVGSKDKSLYAISRRGDKLWSYSTQGKVLSSPVIGVNGTVYVGSEDGSLYAISRKGNKNWSYSTGGEIESAPAIGKNGAIYFGSRDGKFYVVSSKGSKLKSFQIGGDISSSACIAEEGSIYVGAGDGKLYSLYSQSQGLYRSKWPMFHNNRRHNGLLDLKPPKITNISKTGDSPCNSVTWSWNATESASYRYTVTQNATYTFSNENFNDTRRITVQDKNGLWYLHVQAVDKSGNVGPSEKDSVLLDNIPPKDAKISGIPQQMSNSTSVNASVSGDEVVKYKYRLDSSSYSKTFSVDTPINLDNLDDGKHVLHVKGIDAAGNLQKDPTNATWKIDATPPEVTHLGLNDQVWNIEEQPKTINSSISKVNIFFQETGSGLDLAASAFELENGSNQEISGNWELFQDELIFTPDNPLPESVYTLKLQLQDDLGNEMDEREFSFAVDTTPPPAPEIARVDSPTHKATQEISGTKALGASVELNGTRIVGFTDEQTWSHEVSLSPGENELFFTCRDRAGNISDNSSVSIVFDDIAPPEVASLSVNGETNGTAAELEWSGFDETQHGDIDKYQVFVREQDFSDLQGMSPVATLSRGTQTHTASGLSRGNEYYFAVAAVDEAGNRRDQVSPVSAEITDADPPGKVLNLQASSSRNSLELTWDPPSGEEPEEYRLYFNGSESTVNLPANQTKWERTGLDTATGYQCAVSAVDSAGNEGPANEISVATWLVNPESLDSQGYDGYVQISWDEISQTSLLDHYAVYASKTDFSSVENMTPAVQSGDNSAKVAGLENNSTYYLAVTSVNISGGEKQEVDTVTAQPIPDTEGPDLSNLSFEGESLDQTQPITESGYISIQSQDPSGVSQVIFRVDGKTLQTIHSSPYKANLDISRFNDGEHTLHIEAVDSLGNVAERNLDFQVDMGKPDAPQITSPSTGRLTNRAELQVKGQTEAGCGIKIYRNGTLVGNSTADSRGEYSVEITLLEGANLVTARAENRAGLSEPSPDVKVDLNTDIPSAPSGVAAESKKQGEVRLSWQRPTDESNVSGYLVYRSEFSFSSPADAKKVSQDPVRDNSYTDLPPSDGRYYYRVMSVNQAGSQSEPSDLARVQADGTPPRALLVEYDPQSEQDPDTGAVAPGRVEVTLKVSEPVITTPFLSVTPEDGNPIPVDLSSAGNRTYSGSFRVKNSTPSGPAWAVFSARDRAGNQGTAVDKGKKILLDTDGPCLGRIALSPSSPVKTSQEDPRKMTVTLGFDEMVAPGTVPDLEYTLSGSGDTPTEIAGLEQISARGGDIQTWRTEFTLPSDAGMDSAQTLSFNYRARDNLDNVCSSIRADNAFQIYQGELPPLQAPQNFSGSLEPGGGVALSWDSVPDCAGYRVYRKAPDQDELTVHSDLIPSGKTEYTEQTETDAEYTYAIASVRKENGETSLSGLSSKVTLATDSSAPAAPTDLSLELAANGVKATWHQPNATDSYTYNLYRSNSTSMDNVSGVSPLITDIPHRDQLRVVDTDPSAAEPKYAITAVDQAGNESPPSDPAYLNKDLMPVSSLKVRQAGDNPPEISWSHPGGDIAGFNVYLGKVLNGTLLNNSPLQEDSFIDPGYRGDQRSYSVVAVDENGRFSPIRRITLPKLKTELQSGQPLRRNVMNSLVYTLKNRSEQEMQNVRLLVELSGREHLSEKVDLPAGSSREVEVTVGGYSDLNGTASLTELVELNPDPGRKIQLEQVRSVQTAPGAMSLFVSTGRFMQGGNGTARLELGNPGKAPVEVVTASGSGQEIKFLLKDNDGNVLDVSKLDQKVGDKVVNLPCGDKVARIPAGESFTSRQVNFSVPSGLSSDNLQVEARVPKVYHSKCKDDEVVMQGFNVSRQVRLSRTSYYGRITSISPEQSNGDEEITIRGQAVDRGSNQTLANTGLTLGISNQGFERERSVRTNSTGEFSFDFTPLDGESGVYKVCAVHPDLTARPVQDRFVVSRVSFDPAQVDLKLPRNYQKTFQVDVQTGKGTQVKDLELQYNTGNQPGGSKPEGVHVEPGDPIDLDSGSSAKLPVTFWANNTAPDQSSLVLDVVSSNSTWGQISINAAFSEAKPVLDFEPSHIETGVSRNSTVTEHITLENTGLDAIKDLDLALLDPEGNEAPSWVYLAGATSGQDLPVGSEQSAGITFSPGSDVSQGRHHFLLRVQGSNHSPVDIHCYANVSSSDKGNVVLKVTDMYTGTKNDQGELIKGLSGAEVDLQNEKVKNITRQAETDEIGEVKFSDLPSGRYRYRISASNHDTKTGRVWVKPGITTAKEVFLSTSLVTVQWDVQETTIEDEYEITLEAKYETDVPAPVVVMQPTSTSLPSMQPGEVFRGEITLTNKGLIRAEEVSATLPEGGDHFRYELLGEVPDTLAAGQRVTIPYKVTCLQLLEQSEGSGGGECGSYTHCMTVDYQWVCANGEWSKQAVNHCWTSVYGDCSSSGDDDSASFDRDWDADPENTNMYGSVPAPDDMDGAECVPSPDHYIINRYKSVFSDSTNENSRKNNFMEDMFQSVGCKVDTFRGLFLDKSVDLSVKVPGGVIKASRWFVGNTWHFEHLRHKLDFEYAGGEVETIYKSKANFNMKSSDSDVYIGQESSIVDDSEGYRWKDKNGNWKRFNEQGRLKAYGDRNGVIGKMLYESENSTKPHGIADRNGEQVIWYEYTGDKVVSARDQSGNEVRYYYTRDNLSKVNGLLGEETVYEYDDKGRMLSKIDPAGRKITIRYTDRGRVKSVRDEQGEGKSFDYGYNEASKQYFASIEYASGRIKEIWYDQNGHTKRVDVNGETVKRIENDSGDLIITSDQEQKIRKEYNEWDKLTRIVYPDGSEVNYSYDHVLHKKTKIVDRRGVTTRLEYDDKGNLIKRIQAAGTDEGRILTYTYNDMVKPVKATIKSADGSSSATTSFSYDDKGNLKSITDPRGHETRFEDYDVMGNPGRIIDSRGNIWEMEYDARGRLKSMTDPLGNTKSYEYDAANNLTAFVNPMLERFEFEYNAHNKMIQATDPMGNTVDIERNSDQLPVKVSKQGNVSTKSDYDNRGRLQERVDGAGNRIKYHYEESTSSNALSDTPVKIDYPTYSKRFYYDKMQRLVRETNVVSQNKTYSKEYEYDASGNIVSATDEQGRTWHYQYDALDRVTELIDPTGNSTRITYDYRGNIKSITAPNNSTVHYEYDQNNNLIKLTRPQQEEITFEYDSAGNMISKTDADGRKVEYDYDALNRITRSRYYNPGDHGTPARTVDFSYDATGNLISYDDGTTSAQYSYDDLGRLTGTTVDYGPFSLSYSYTYTSDGLKKSLTYPDGTTVEYSYDNSDRLTGVDIPGQGRVSIGEFTWNSPAKVSYPGGSEKQINHDPLMRTSNVTALDPGDNAVLDRDYGYSSVGNLLSKETEQEEFFYTYDKLSRLTNSSSEEYTYDSVGNRLSSADTSGNWSYNRNNELLDNGNSSFEYDESGRLIKRDIPGGELHYSYNAQGRISKIEDGTGNVIAEYYYDPFGRRLWKEVDGERTYYLYSREGLIGEYKESGQAIRNYGYRPDTTWGSNPLFLKKDSDYYWYLNDRQGTPKKLISNNGKVVWSANYDSFGKAHVITEIVKNNLRLAGQYFDAETGLHYNLNRYYDPNLGRYLTPDPLREGLNPYLYAQNNPLRYIDPLGLCVLQNPWISNSVAFVGGVLQAMGGFAIATTTGISGVGAVAGGAVAVQGSASASVAFGNLVVLFQNQFSSSDLKPLVSTSGVAGMVTSSTQAVIGSENVTLNNLATVTDMSVNLAASASGVNAANSALSTATQPGTIAGNIADTTFGQGAWAPSIGHQTATATNVTTITGTTSTTVNSLERQLNQ